MQMLQEIKWRKNRDFSLDSSCFLGGFFGFAFFFFFNIQYYSPFGFSDNSVVEEKRITDLPAAV